MPAAPFAESSELRPSGLQRGNRVAGFAFAGSQSCQQSRYKLRPFNGPDSIETRNTFLNFDVPTILCMDQIQSPNEIVCKVDCFTQSAAACVLANC
jgi:hypothetical protein